jgi:hypothetical protein
MNRRARERRRVGIKGGGIDGTMPGAKLGSGAGGGITTGPPNRGGGVGERGDEKCSRAACHVGGALAMRSVP